MRKLRALLGAYREAGGKQAVVLFHDAEHGGELIDALARHGDGLPANVLPVQVNEVTQVGLEAVAAAFAYGAIGGALPAARQAAPRSSAASTKTIALAEPILSGLGFAGARVATIETDDPDALGETLARHRADGRRGQARDASPPSAASATCMRLALARTACGGAGAGRYRRAAAGRAVRHGRGQCRGLHAVPVLRVGLPDRRAVATIPSGRCCASPRTPACNAGCARRPARRK